jgi:hypothetical protein
MNNKLKTALIITSAILVIGLLAFFLTQNTFLSTSSMKTADGKSYWVITAVADSVGEKASFFKKLPSSGTQPDGTKIIPQDALEITFSKGNMQCEYLANRVQDTVKLRLLPDYDFIYYTLSSPERVIEFDISDDRGNSKTIDGTVQNTIVFKDKDGKGEAVVQSVGTLQVKQDCP